jgi:hypothetical protein
VVLFFWPQSLAVVFVLAESSAETSDPLTAAAKTLIGWLQQHYGGVGVVAAVVLLTWWQWRKPKELPGVAPLAGWLKDGHKSARKKQTAQQTVPITSPGKKAVKSLPAGRRIRYRWLLARWWSCGPRSLLETLYREWVRPVVELDDAREPGEES